MLLVGHQKPVSPYLKGHISANNKRPLQGCDDEPLKNGHSLEPSSKRPRLNGNSIDPIREGDQGSSDGFHIVPGETPLGHNIDNLETPKLGRKSKRMSRLQDEAEGMLKQRMASVMKSSGKVRTTRELVQDMALRSQSPGDENSRFEFDQINALYSAGFNLELKFFLNRQFCEKRSFYVSRFSKK